MFEFDFGEVLFPFGLGSPVNLLTDELFTKPPETADRNLKNILRYSCTFHK